MFLHIFRKYFLAIPCCVKCPYFVKCLPKLPPFSISASNNFPRFSSIGTIILSSDNPSTSFITYITAPANFHKPRCFNSLCTTSNAVEAEESVVKAELPEASEAISPIASRRSHPAQSGETFDGPPSLERSGSEHRVGRLHPRFLRKRGLGRKWSPLWKEGRGDSKN